MKHQALQNKQIPVLQNIKILRFFLFLSALLDPDLQTRWNPDLIRIRIPNTNQNRSEKLS
jgi:hypothetical protein